MLTSQVSPLFSGDSRGSPLSIEESSKHTATEITAQLTAVDENSTATLDEMTSFQSAKDRLERMNRPQKNSGLSGATSGNWRRSAGSTDLGITGQEDSPRQRNLSSMAGEGMVPISSVVPGPAWPNDEQQQVAYGYAIRREDGTYTRLIRADEIATLDLKSIPTSQGPEGLIALPALKLACPERRDGPEQFVSRDLVSSLPPDRPNRPKFPPGLREIEEVQRSIDQITSKGSVDGAAPTPAKTPRRTKIYCDKWIHEGVCAFTQLGCKYKHEMPMDKATQLSLGLNHGLPTWYKRAHAIQLRPEPQASPPSPTQTRTAGPWRRTDTPSGHSTGLSLDSGISPSPPGQPFHRPNFGPIAPPPPQYLRQPPPSYDPYSMLQQEDTKMEEEDEEEDDEDEITWSGRRR